MPLNPLPIQNPYSFKDLVGTIVSPGGVYNLTGGNVGFGQLSLAMGAEKGSTARAADGVVLPQYEAGDDGTITMEMQQTSSLHHYLLGVFNLIKTAADAGDISLVAATSITLRTLIDGSTHIATGVMFEKIPDKSYAAKGGNVTWTFRCCNIQTLS